ncbi:GT2 family glycosyltransferase/glycosyltransferase involved in cell wall biosynthesis [Variovorax sp. TBS-050B]|uniref:glycosyltransferase n=1 Tax=Variovorax sp. TBS-050B TaxID=2940551 RepID=UPI0024730AEE|nr:glycosyltransferase [Variovorax sp. TBS-050B]MDH6592543.1 GT2 family glycosyltransferase/glycosyltransferase involved in cell wall biosynthesis [Variovorax sp. TBS-050B]
MSGLKDEPVVPERPTPSRDTPTEATAGSPPGIVFRVVLGALLFLPAAIHCGGGAAVFRSWRRTPNFVSTILMAHHEIHARLQARSKWVRWPVFAAFSLGFRLHSKGTIQRAFRDTWHLLREDGLKKLPGAVRLTVPGGIGIELPPRKQQIDAAVDVDTPAFRVRARRVLVLDYRIPRADNSAGELAMLGVLRDLVALGYGVVFMPNDMAPAPRHESVLRDLGVEVVTRESGFSGTRHFIERHGAEFGVFYVARFDVAESALSAIRTAAPTARVLFHAPDLHFLRERREAKLLGDRRAMARAEETRRRELAVMHACDHVVVVSPAEVPVLREALSDETPISIFPVLYAPVEARVAPYEARKDVFFLGGFGHKPNVSAVEWFVREVWPAVRASLPGACFHVIGADVPPGISALERVPGVKVIGFVPDLAPVLSGYRVGVAPLLYGAGIKGKVAMTLGAGIPCVCTRIAAEGMGIEDGVHAMVTSDATGFAKAVIALYQDGSLWRRLSVHGQELVRARFGEAANRGALLRVLNDARVLPIPLWQAHCENLQSVVVPAPPADVPVDVTIIVPAFNQWAMTRACIASIVCAGAGTGVRYEVIVADDGSTDETRSAETRIPGLRVVRTPRNLGFLKNCNHAATHARGKYILLLNNDAVVLPGWLDGLHDTLESDASIAIAGSKLLNQDGSLQEAGGGLLSDASGVSIGRWLRTADGWRRGARDEAVFNFQRETDYVTGASLIVRTSFWRAVGGFDESFEIAYCEDSDLAMRARALGHKVVYQPRSEAVHLEHQSYADVDEGADAKGRGELQRHNKALMAEKWKHVLARDHLPPGSEWERVAAHGERAIPPVILERRKKSKVLRILYFSPFPSHPSNHGNQATIQQFARQFQAMGHKVHFVVLRSGLFDADAERAMREAWDTLDVLPNSHALGANGAPIPFDGWYAQGLGERIRVLCARYGIDVLLCSYVFQSKMLDYIPSYILRIIDTHDKMGHRYDMLRQKGLPLEFFSCTPEEEGAYLRRADVVLARRREEADYFDSVSGRNSSVVVPHFEAPHFVDKRFEKLERVVIVASANQVNLAIVRDFLQTLDRRLAGKSCPFVVVIAGQVKDLVALLPLQEQKLFKRSWIRMTGFIEDIGGFYAKADLVVSPVTMGTGINVKTVQAMAYGMPLLTTAWGSKGIETSEPLHGLASVDELVEALFKLAASPGELERLKTCSREAYQRFFDASQAVLRDVLDRVPRGDERERPARGLPQDIALEIAATPATASAKGRSHAAHEDQEDRENH